MKKIFISLAIGCCLLSRPALAATVGNGPINLIVTLLTGAAAAGAAMNADTANSLYQEKKGLAEQLKAQGIDPANRAIYSAYLQLDKDAIYWERWVGWPNMMLEVEIAGQGSFLIPRIDMGYQGQPILQNLVGQYAKPGTRIIVHVLDDKQFQNAVWNSILKSKINLKLSADYEANEMIRANAQANGSIQILNSNLTIVNPVCMATADFIVPNSKDPRWLADASFRDNNNKVIGKLQFQQMWSNPVSEAHSRFIFWIVITVVLGLVFAKLLFAQKPTA